MEWQHTFLKFKLFLILGRKKIAVVRMELKHKNCIIVYEK